jgi:hypothetical protein
MVSISRKLLSWVIPSLFLSCSFSSQAEVTLNSGESFQTSFELHADGNVFRISDYEWDVELMAFDSANPPGTYGGTGFITVTMYENIDYTGNVFTITEDSGASSVFGGTFDSRFSDWSGSMRISYTGTGVLELQLVTISNNAGNIGPSFVATTSFVPVTSPVPWPPALMLFVPGLLATGLMVVRRQRSAAAT